MTTVQVELGSRRYPIHIGEGLLGRSELLAPHIVGRQVLVVTDEQVAPHYLQSVLASFSRYETEQLILPAGESHKTLATLNQIFDVLLERRFSRDAMLVALGGGVIGDMVGFAAASYQRGVDFIQMPTTLLAQVDSSVGGKTAVNHPLGKNMIGAFHQPRCVIADTSTLKSLDPRQLRAGCAEVIKYGLISDANFFAWLESHLEEVLSLKPQAIAEAVRRSCENKAAVVSADEHERGQRALLNLGHTFGHAIETGLGYGRWIHGEAVAAGMVMAAEMSVRLCMLPEQEAVRIRELLERAKLPTELPSELGVESMLKHMSVDKKVLAGKLRLVLLEAIGQALLVDDFDPVALRETLQVA